MNYIHAGGFYFNGSTSRSRGALPPDNWLTKPMTWGWQTLMATRGEAIPLSRTAKKELERAKLKKQLEGPLREMKNALEEYIFESDTGDNNPIIRAYEICKPMRDKGLISGFDDFCGIALNLAKKSDLDNKMKDCSIKEQHSVLIEAADFASEIKKKLGVEPLLICRKSFKVAAGDKVKKAPSTILSEIYLCFDRRHNAVDCHIDYVKLTNTLICASRIYFVPRGPLPENHPYVISSYARAEIGGKVARETVAVEHGKNLPPKPEGKARTPEEVVNIMGASRSNLSREPKLKTLEDQEQKELKLLSKLLSQSELEDSTVSTGKVVSLHQAELPRPMAEPKPGKMAQTSNKKSEPKKPKRLEWCAEMEKWDEAQHKLAEKERDKKGG